MTFLEQDDRSLNEVDSSPRRVMHFKPLALAATNLMKMKRKAPSPPDSSLESKIDEKVKELSEEDDTNSENDSNINLEEINSHEPLGAKLSASLRQTFRLS